MGLQVHWVTNGEGFEMIYRSKQREMGILTIAGTRANICRGSRLIGWSMTGMPSSFLFCSNTCLSFLLLFAIVTSNLSPMRATCCGYCFLFLCYFVEPFAFHCFSLSYYSPCASFSACFGFLALLLFLGTFSFSSFLHFGCVNGLEQREGLGSYLDVEYCLFRHDFSSNRLVRCSCIDI